MDASKTTGGPIKVRLIQLFFQPLWNSSIGLVKPQWAYENADCLTDKLHFANKFMSTSDSTTLYANAHHRKCSVICRTAWILIFICLPRALARSFCWLSNSIIILPFFQGECAFAVAPASMRSSRALAQCPCLARPSALAIANHTHVRSRSFCFKLKKGNED